MFGSGSSIWLLELAKRTEEEDEYLRKFLFRLYFTKELSHNLRFSNGEGEEESEEGDEDDENDSDERVTPPLFKANDTLEVGIGIIMLGLAKEEVGRSRLMDRNNDI